MADTCRIYIVRHAIAAERGNAYPDDRLRPLTPAGIERFRKVVRGLAWLDVRVDRILTSPLVRARQTADILAENLPGKPQVIETDALVPGATYDELRTHMAEFSRCSSVALVGHEPDIGHVAARLLGLRHPLAFKKGGVCRIDMETLPPAGPGELRWFVPPRMLARLR
ncbi:MAG: phosphohistidine phosphatase SixA [Acidobacteria bacterium]|nr:MAG: phosphohistidine phosphatase SixA [Acidobacteriota bacterium]RPJ75667.1 MAG: phosphohistidine phosphatase SixA [Acidobacteriota bacterium]